MKVAFRTVWFQIPIFRGLGGSSMKKLTLGDVCKKESSNIAQKDIMECEGEYPIYGAGGFIKNVNFYQQELPYIAVVKDGAGIGRTMLLPAYSSVIGTMQYILPIDYESIDLQYLYYAIVHMDLGKYFSGATIPHIYFKDYKKEKLFLPEICEQQRISLLLKQVDLMIEKQNNQVELVDKLVQSRFVELFVGKNYDIVKAGSIIKEMRNGVSPSTSGGHFEKVLTLSAITQGKFDDKAWKEGFFTDCPSTEKRITEDDFYICRGNGNKSLVGMGVYALGNRPDLVFPDTVIAAHIDTERMVLPYLWIMWQQPEVRKQLESGARTTNGTYKINQKVISKIKMICPPINEQEVFADFIKQLDKSKLSDLLPWKNYSHYLIA